ncbi:MAG TPA: GTPase ObgE [Candidatus Acidoferrales bacterium]|nr:GTPase ObgE [Candidatus Acidoferrales bacterium]
MFVDEARIYVKAGDGGRGCVAFRREKFVPRGGPSGGDGGQGGSVELVSTIHENTLLRYRFNREFRADSGRHGQGSNCHGKSGGDSVLDVPIGTLVYDEDSGELLFDFTRQGERFMAAKGGRGGRGNQHFAKPWHQAPRESEDGEPGQERHLRLELRLLADVGLVGLPNAGKSTLISRISAARPKIADYPFTTLEPHLGVVSVDGPRPGVGGSFVVADLPGLIEGAHEGAGLGIRFLRHIERTRLVAHLVDCSGATPGDPVHDFEVVRHELIASSETLAAKPFLVAATKLDATTDRAALDALRAHCAAHGYPFYAVSSATGEGIKELVRAMANALETLPRATDPIEIGPLETDEPRETAAHPAPSQPLHSKAPSEGRGN